MGDLGGFLFAGGIEHALHRFSGAAADGLERGAFSLVRERKNHLVATLAGRDGFSGGRRNDALADFKILTTGMSL